jgi:hypothetical protein
MTELFKDDYQLIAQPANVMNNTPTIIMDTVTKSITFNLPDVPELLKFNNKGECYHLGELVTVDKEIFELMKMFLKVEMED